MTAYRLPPAFFADHVDRDLLHRDEAVVRTTKRYVVVDLTDTERDELLSDARHYADPDMGYRRDYPGLVRSAEATVTAILNTMVKEGMTW